MISDALSKLESLKKERNAVILTHYYQNPYIQDVADFMGGSLALAQLRKWLLLLRLCLPQLFYQKIINSRHRLL